MQIIYHIIHIDTLVANLFLNEISARNTFLGYKFSTFQKTQLISTITTKPSSQSVLKSYVSTYENCQIRTENSSPISDTSMMQRCRTLLTGNSEIISNFDILCPKVNDKRNLLLHSKFLNFLSIGQL